MLTPPAPIDRQAAFNLSLMLSGGVVDNDETKENEEARIAQAAEYMAFAATPIFPREDYDLEHLVSATGIARYKNPKGLFAMTQRISHYLAHLLFR